MINRQKGQLRIGTSGPVMIGELPPDGIRDIQQEPSKGVGTSKPRRKLDRTRQKSFKITRRERRDRNERKIKASLRYHR